LNKGPHGFSEILYAFSSQTGNNGSAFAGLTGNTPFYNITGGFAMLIGRYGMIVPILALAGSMAAKRRVAPSLGTFPTTGPIWTVLLIGVVIIVGALTFFPALSLGPIVEQLLQNAGKVF
jgi:K+-transporting ATPase ATPase A chain